MDNYERKKRYKEILEQLQDIHCDFSKYVMNIGVPCFDDNKVPTAAVMLDPLIKRFYYSFNPDFFDSLPDEQVMFIICHETLHILFRHLNSPLMKKSSRYNKQIVNMAMDAVINDIIVEDFKIKMPFQVVEDPNNPGTFSEVANGVTGENLIGVNCLDLAMEKVYNKIEKKAQSEQSIFGGKGDGKLLSKEELEELLKNYEGLDIHDWEDITDEDLEEAIGNADYNQDGDKEKADEEDTSKPIQDENKDVEEDRHGFRKGRGAGDFNKTVIIDPPKVPFSLKFLVKNIMGKIAGDDWIDNWGKYNPKTFHCYPKMIFPLCDFQEKDKKLSALFCIDVSGSIEIITAQRFLGIAKKHDKENDFEVKVLTFDTRVRPLNLKKDKTFPHGGGTSFDSLINYINSNRIKYDVVFVLTDGDGGYINERMIDPTRWFWLITPGGYEVDHKYGESHYIPKEYMENVKI